MRADSRLTPLCEAGGEQTSLIGEWSHSPAPAPLSAVRSYVGGRPLMNMSHPVDRSLRLWSGPPPNDEVEALSAFREVRRSLLGQWRGHGVERPCRSGTNGARGTDGPAPRSARQDRLGKPNCLGDATDRTAHRSLIHTARHVAALRRLAGEAHYRVITVGADRLRSVWVTGDDLG